MGLTRTEIVLCGTAKTALHGADHGTSSCVRFGSSRPLMLIMIDTVDTKEVINNCGRFKISKAARKEKPPIILC